MQQQYYFEGGKTKYELSCGNLSSGMYIATITDQLGRKQNIKFIIDGK
jgi:hypothetical protein